MLTNLKTQRTLNIIILNKIQIHIHDNQVAENHKQEKCIEKR
jgi:hypothetical protein